MDYFQYSDQRQSLVQMELANRGCTVSRPSILLLGCQNVDFHVGGGHCNQDILRVWTFRD
ncbi:hypothetical protein PHLCEN_2v13182 [Hermanssonia centrifuga]|uniref:Uncharacterized protein n=1 Tax=Hermanssonia centrifuga TaxID=98765 RepID=A0A2R6NEZ3_9APHY|nr:hypothetical protein PHLCEN_2v13182 [Hermanssonia centrifuga]